MRRKTRNNSQLEVTKERNEERKQKKELYEVSKE